MRQVSDTGRGGWLAAAVWAAFSGQAVAQVALFDESALVTACQQEACIEEVEGALTRLRRQGLEEADINSQIGFIAAVLLDSAGSTQAEALPQMGAALGVLSRYSTDARQSAAIAQVAGAVVRGEAGTIAASAPYAASPSRPFNWWDRPPRRSRSDFGRARNGNR